MATLCLQLCPLLSVKTLLSVIFQTLLRYYHLAVPFRTNLTLTLARWEPSLCSSRSSTQPSPALLCTCLMGLPYFLMSSWVSPMRGGERESLRYLFLLIPSLLGHWLAVATLRQVTLSYSSALPSFQELPPLLAGSFRPE